jgi:RND family efflux transporter MFP subunit
MSWRVPRGGLLLLLLALSLASCRRQAAEEPETLGTTVGVVTALATMETLRDSIVSEGLVVPSAEADLTVTAPEPALIAALPKAVGDTVAVGDVLARFDIPAITELLTTREREFGDATSRLQSARAQAERNQSLFDRGLIPRNQLEASQAAIDPAQRALAAAKEQLDIARQQQDRAVVRATFAGKVVRRFHEVGEFVAGSSVDPVLRVVDPARIEVSLMIPAVHAGRIAAGQPATIQASGIGDTLPATVSPRGLLSQPGASSTEVRLTFAGAPPPLPVDTPVRAEIVFAERPSTIVVPSATIQRDDTTSFVMIAAPDSFARRRAVRIGLVAGEKTEILEGVSAGERLIVRPLDQISDGVAITVER